MPAFDTPRRFDGHVARLTREGSIWVDPVPPGPPQRIDGYTIGVVPVDVGPGPHDGEMHPDGDEFLYVVSGALRLVVDDGDEHGRGGTETVHQLHAGDAFVVRKGTWHRLDAIEPSVLMHMTPGPNGPARLPG